MRTAGPLSVIFPTKGKTADDSLPISDWKKRECERHNIAPTAQAPHCTARLTTPRDASAPAHASSAALAAA